MSNYSVGHQAEKEASEFLVKNGFKINSLNWSTPTCEIDIIATKHETIYFIEVKFRKSTSQGDGFEYITSKKLKQMHYSAEVWLSMNDWEGDSTLAAISATPNGFTFVEI